MWILVGAVVTASLLGSLHCVGMCGPLALWAAGADRSRDGISLTIASALYHLGRMLTYGLVGAAAGFLGTLLDWSGGALGIQLMAARVFGGFMIVIGCIAGYRILQPTLSHWFASWMSGFRRRFAGSGAASRAQVGPVAGSETAWPNELADDGSEATNVDAVVKHTNGSQGGYQPPKPSWLTGMLLRFRPAVFRLPLPARGLITGLLTALLPCGWLYLFALLAAGTGSALHGAIVMLAFWLGSVPALVSLVISTRLLTTPIRRAVPAFAAALLVIAGAYTATGRGFAELSGKLQVSSSLLDQLQSGQSIDEISPEQVQAGLQQLTATPLPCCQTDRPTSADPSQIEPTASRPIDSETGSAER
jgi:uncharacterized protein